MTLQDNRGERSRSPALEFRSNGSWDQTSTGAEFASYLSAVLRRWWLVVLGAGIVGFAAWWTSQAPLVYTATTTLLVNGAPTLPSAGGLQLNRELAITAKDLVTTRPVLDRAHESLGEEFSPRRLKGSVRVDIVGSGSLMAITATDLDPTVAEKISAKVSDAFAEQSVQDQLSSVARFQSAAAAQGIALDPASIAAQLNSIASYTVVEPPQAQVRSTAISRSTVMALGLILGAVSGSFLAVFWHRLSDRIESAEHSEALFGLPALGIVARWNGEIAGGRHFVFNAESQSGHAEAFRHIATNLTFMTGPSDAKVILVTSPSPGDGKTTISLNIAAALAERADARVLLVDADLRRPTVQKVLGLSDPGPGLSKLLADRSSELSDAVRQTAVKSLDVITAGPIPPNPAALMTSPHLVTLVGKMRERYTYVVFDTSPALAVADTAILGRVADGYILVANSGTTRTQQLRAALRMLGPTGTPVFGLILNRFKKPRFGYSYGTSYGYYYRYDGYQSAPEQNGTTEHVKLKRWRGKPRRRTADSGAER